MAAITLKRWNRSPGEAFPSLSCLTFFLLLLSQAPATVWYLNDTNRAGDCFTRAIGNDETGNGSEDRPFRSLTGALSFVKAGDTLKIDTGDYEVLSAEDQAERKSSPITLSRLFLKGAGPEKTILHVNGKNGLSFAGAQQIKLEDFCVTGGDTGLLLDHCTGATLLRIRTRDSVNYGILIKDSTLGKIEDCRTENSGFRGLHFAGPPNTSYSTTRRLRTATPAFAWNDRGKIA